LVVAPTHEEIDHVTHAICSDLRERVHLGDSTTVTNAFVAQEAQLLKGNHQKLNWLTLFQGIRPLNRSKAITDALAGFQLAAMNIPQALGYTKIAGMPVVTGFYTLLLPLLAFATFGSSRYLVVAVDSATAAILAGGISGMAVPGSARYVALAGMVALLTAGLLLLARVLKLGFLADLLSRTVRIGFLTGVGFHRRPSPRDVRFPLIFHARLRSTSLLNKPAPSAAVP
jgi:hypothetical protein